MSADTSQRPLRELLDDVAARTPAPGGGTSAAWTAALAAALVEMAATFAEDAAAGARASELRARALDLADQELHSYTPVIEAWRLPDDDPGKRERVRAALVTAADSPRVIAAVAAEVAELAKRLAATGKPSLAGDAETGATLADAACRAANRLAEINLSEAELLG
jgi:formiminotetrahydrofolate cyclodeaminase